MKFIKSKLPHKYLGLVMIIASQLGIVSGIKEYHRKAQKEGQGNVLVILNLLFFSVMIIIGEVMHQITLRKKVPFISGKP